MKILRTSVLAVCILSMLFYAMETGRLHEIWGTPGTNITGQSSITSVDCTRQSTPETPNETTKTKLETHVVREAVHVYVKTDKNLRKNTSVPVHTGEIQGLDYVKLFDSCIGFDADSRPYVQIPEKYARGVCIDNRIRMRAFSHNHGKKYTILKTDQYINCSTMAPLIDTRNMTNMVAVATGDIFYHFGWHSILDKFMSYYATWSDEDARNIHDRKKCHDMDVVLLHNTDQHVDDNLVHFQYSSVLGHHGQFLPVHNKRVQCYHTVHIGARPSRVHGAYNHFLQSKSGKVVQSFARCLRAYFEMQDKPDKNKILFLNRDRKYGMRHVINLQEISRVFNDEYRRPVNVSVQYVDDIASMSLSRQLEVTSLCTRTIISPHGSQLTWILFLRQKSTVLEIFPMDPGFRNKRDYADLSKAANLEYIRIEGRGGVKNEYIYIDKVRDLLQIVARTLDAHKI